MERFIVNVGSGLKAVSGRRWLYETELDAPVRAGPRSPGPSCPAVPWWTCERSADGELRQPHRRTRPWDRRKSADRFLVHQMDCTKLNWPEEEIAVVVLLFAAASPPSPAPSLALLASLCTSGDSQPMLLPGQTRVRAPVASWRRAAGGGSRPNVSLLAPDDHVAVR